jgi:hypothetical protein
LLLLLLHAWSLLNCNSRSTHPFFLFTIIRGCCCCQQLRSQ